MTIIAALSIHLANHSLRLHQRKINLLGALHLRKATLLGSNALLKVDPIALATEVGLALTSTQRLRKAWEDFMAMDKRALRNGGPGYGDWRDDRDREELARREREKANTDD
jgi:hypothetical protein